MAAMQMIRLHSGIALPSVDQGSGAMLADWIELNLITDPEQSGNLSRFDVIDLLCESTSLNVEQDEVAAYVENCIARIRARKRSVNLFYPIKYAGDVFEIDPSCLDIFPYAFLLAFSVAPHYPEWRDFFIRQRQRDAFEHLTIESLRQIFTGWQVMGSGWATHGRSHGGICKRMVELFDAVPNGRPELLASANDGQIDIIAIRKFQDLRGVYPGYLVQCATGSRDLDKKALEPNLDVWQQVVSFLHLPRKALAVPFDLGGEEFTKLAAIGATLIIDRTRILSHLSGPLEGDLFEEIALWIITSFGMLPLHV